MEYFRELVLPSLVADVQSLFWKHIDPYGLPALPTRKLRALTISPDDPRHQAMRDIMSKYPFLVEHMLIFKLPPQGSTGIHLDGLGGELPSRKHSCNIPIEGCTADSVTEFFEVDHNDLLHDKVNTTRFLSLDKPSTKLCEYILVDNPVLCNTQAAHRVNNDNGKGTRISVSWTVNPNWTFDGVAKYVAKTY